MSGLTDEQLDDLYRRWLQKTSFTHLTAAVERILAEQETRLRESIAADIEAHCDDGRDCCPCDCYKAASIARGGAR